MQFIFNASMLTEEDGADYVICIMFASPVIQRSVCCNTGNIRNSVPTYNKKTKSVEDYKEC
jgi:hypothetical protein